MLSSYDVTLSRQEVGYTTWRMQTMATPAGACIGHIFLAFGRTGMAYCLHGRFYAYKGWGNLSILLHFQICMNILFSYLRDDGGGGGVGPDSLVGRI